MKKLLLSFAVIMALLVLVSCPDGMMPTSILDISLVVEEGSEVSLKDKFKELTYEVIDIEGGRDVKQTFSTIEKITIPVVSIGEYEVIITGEAEDDDFTYQCNGSKTFTVSEGQTTTPVKIILTITKTPKTKSIAVSFVNRIVDSEEYDLTIKTIDYSFKSGEDQISEGGGIAFSPETSCTVSVPTGVQELEYTVIAKNNKEETIGESNGILNLEEGIDSYSITILEKEGNGTLEITAKKDKEAQFPSVSIGEEVYTITALEDSETEGSVSIELKNGNYTVTVGEESVDVRVVYNQTKTLTFDFSTPLIPVDFVDNIIKDSNYNLTISKIDYSFKALDKEYSATGVKFTDDFSLSIPKVVGEYEYSVSAYNSDNKLIGEASGTLLIEDDTERHSIDIEEKEGKGTLIVSVTKERDAVFLPVTIGETEYPITPVEGSVTEGSVSISLDSGSYTVSICGKEVEVRIVYGQERTISYNYATPLLTVTLRDRIVKSEDHDLNIAKIDYSFPDFEEKYSGTGVDYTENLNIHIPKINGSFEYSVIAYNEEGTIIGEGIGSLTIDDDTKISAILIKEKTGNATIKFELTKNANEKFPTIRVGNDNVTITVSEDKTKGSGSFTVQNGTHSIYVGSEKVDEVRVVYDEEKTLKYDLTEYYLYLNFVDKINKDNADGLNLVIDTLEVSFKDSSKEFVINPKYDSSPKRISISNSDYILNVNAKNSEGVVIGEGSGNFPLDDGQRDYTVDISEREGNGYLEVNGLRDSGNDFPSIVIGDKTYEFTEVDSTTGKRTIELKNGTYTVNCDGEEKTIRIAVDQINSIEYDFRTPAVITIKDNIPKYEGFNMDISSIRYSIKSLNNEECVYSSGAEKVNWTDDFEIPVSFVPGLWEYDIVAYNKDGIEIGEAKYAFWMKNNSPSISIEEKTGNGSVDISLKFNSNVETPSAFISNKSINLVKDGDVWKASVENINTGSYVLKVDGKEFALRVVNGMTTVFSEDLSYDIDVSIENGVSSSQEFKVNVYPVGKDGEISASLSAVNGEIPSGVDVAWYLGSTPVGSGTNIFGSKFNDVQSGIYTLKAVVTKSGKVIGIATCVVKYTV